MAWPKARRRLVISQFPFFRTARSWLSFTRQLATTLRSRIRGTRFISLLAAIVSFLMESGVTRSRLVHSCLFPLARFTALRTFHPTLRCGSYFTDPRAASRDRSNLEVMKRVAIIISCGAFGLLALFVLVELPAHDPNAPQFQQALPPVAVQQ